MFIGGVVVRVQPAAAREVEVSLRALPGVQIADSTEEGFALVLEGETPKQQRQRHEAIEQWPGVEQVRLVFQSGPLSEHRPDEENHAKQT